VKRVLAVLHAPAEPLGLLERPLRGAGLVIETTLAEAGLPPSLEGHSGLVVMGGPMGVYEADRYPFLVAEEELLREALRRGLPTLGVCLGAQLLAAAGGVRVFRGPAPEVGWAPVRRVADDAWLRGWPRTFEPLHWHGDTFDLPEDAVLLASSSCYAQQAFRLGSGLGLQFHVEATAEMARAWMRDPDLPPAWRLDTGQVERCEAAAAAMTPLAVGLAEAFARAVLEAEAR
jgi:GMP synthase-like glutamine amidotransferase